MTLDVYADRETIRAHAREAAPFEACGFIVGYGGHKQKAIRCRNASSQPEHHFLIPPEDYRRAENEGKILAVYHSHYRDGAVANDGDKTESEKHKTPFVIYSVSADAWTVYMPCGWKAKLEGRPFIHGILDCYTLVRDYYAEMLKIELDDFYREDDWWKPTYDASGKVIAEPKNLYLDNFESQGFVQVPDIHVHDVLLMHILADVPNHAAVYCEAGTILHHPPGHVSGKHPYSIYGGGYRDATYGIFRHTRLM